jgi:ribonuclease BN (tRNA processing enzyme)
MKLKFIGTSNANPHPGRNQSALYLESGGIGYLIDCGDGAPTALWLDPDIDWNGLRGLLLTHLHPDHAGGIFNLFHLLNEKVKQEPDSDLHLHQDMKLCLPRCRPSKRITGALGPFHLSRETLAFNLNFIFYRPGSPFLVGDLEVLPLPTSHCDEAHGFTLTIDGKRIVVSGDLGEAQDITAHEKEADLVICECTHFPPAELTPALLELNAPHYVITHLHDKLIRNIDQVKDRFRPLARNAQVTIAHDGLVLEL